MKTIKIIKSEHRNLASVLYSIEKLIEEIDRDSQPNFAVFHGLFTYIDRFLDRYHHPKENDYLFPRILARAPEAEALIKELGQQHKEGEKLLAEMLKALSAYEFSGETEYPTFREVVLKYTDFERKHAIKEEQELLPIALEALDASDWQEIDQAFGENEDPMFGEQWSGEFSTIFNKLVNELPAPLGLGEKWKK
ncbi:MAG: branched-chain amino acid transport system ATP-binding protein [Gammaproteobacteria bacterium]|jgi:branched-chain amino acid transport system ATP-binding protein